MCVLSLFYVDSREAVQPPNLEGPTYDLCILILRLQGHLRTKNNKHCAFSVPSALIADAEYRSVVTPPPRRDSSHQASKSRSATPVVHSLAKVWE